MMNPDDGSKNDDDDAAGHTTKDNENNHQKRGMKPRSKRNRKRPRSDVNAVQEDFVYETRVRRLELDGKPLASLKHQNAQWLRLVEPYPYTFSTFAKARWEGRTLMDVYCTEFGSYPPSYYQSAIAQGRILVSDQKVDPSYKLKGGDVLSHTVHRHEPGVAVQSPDAPHATVIAETDDVLVVDKPATVPVHPCGGYHVQSLMNILEKHYGKLYTIHRLDRLTSGLVILGKRSAVAQAWGKNIMNRDCQKIYLARVKGKFPSHCPDHLKRLSGSNEAIPWHGEWYESLTKLKAKQPAGAAKHAASVADLRKQYAHAYWVTDGSERVVVEDDVSLEDVFHCQNQVQELLQSLETSNELSTSDAKTQSNWLHLACPTRVAQHKDGICLAGSFDDLDNEVYKKTVKPAHSSFAVVSYDSKSDTTLLVCRPYTGRTHQLRLHLQYLGHPIANDPNYGGDMWFCNQEGEQGAKMAQDRLDIIRDDKNDDGTEPTANTTATDVPATEKEIESEVSPAVQQKDETIHDFIRRTCVWCARSKAVGGEDRTILEFMIRSPGIWLHALQYTFYPAPDDKSNPSSGSTNEQRLSYRAPLPAWFNL